jgi:hypothetical protein
MIRHKLEGSTAKTPGTPKSEEELPDPNPFSCSFGGSWRLGGSLSVADL